MSVRGCSVTVSLDLVTEECCNCGMPFAMPKDFERRARENSAIFFYCPRGHSQHYTNQRTLAQAERDLKAAKEAQEFLNQRLSEVRRERDHHWTERKKVNTRLRNLKQRVANGVCPCCHRSFENLRRHMATKHPQYPLPVVPVEGGAS